MDILRLKCHRALWEVFGESRFIQIELFSPEAGAEDVIRLHLGEAPTLLTIEDHDGVWHSAVPLLLLDMFVFVSKGEPPAYTIQLDLYRPGENTWCSQ